MVAIFSVLNDLRNSHLHDPILAVGPAPTRPIALKYEGWFHLIELLHQVTLLDNDKCNQCIYLGHPS